MFPVAFWPFQKSNEQSILVPGIPGPQDGPKQPKARATSSADNLARKEFGETQAGFPKWGFDLDPSLIYPLVNSHIAIENGPVETVDLPIKHGDFP